jgi:hypothetical protein
MTHPRPAPIRTAVAPGSLALGRGPAAQTSSGGPAKPVIVGIFSVAAALLLLAFAPTRLFASVLPDRVGLRLGPARTTLAGAGVSLVVGAAIASLL